MRAPLPEPVEAVDAGPFDDAAAERRALRRSGSRSSSRPSSRSTNAAASPRSRRWRCSASSMRACDGDHALAERLDDDVGVALEHRHEALQLFEHRRLALGAHRAEQRARDRRARRATASTTGRSRSSSPSCSSSASGCTSYAPTYSDASRTSRRAPTAPIAARRARPRAARARSAARRPGATTSSPNASTLRTTNRSVGVAVERQRQVVLAERVVRELARSSSPTTRRAAAARALHQHAERSRSAPEPRFVGRAVSPPSRRLVAGFSAPSATASASSTGVEPVERRARPRRAVDDRRGARPSAPRDPVASATASLRGTRRRRRSSSRSRRSTGGLGLGRPSRVERRTSRPRPVARSPS